MQIFDDDSIEYLARLSRDLKSASAELGPDEARFLVDLYYICQEDRKRARNQAKAMETEPHRILDWASYVFETMEITLKGIFKNYAIRFPVGEWSLAQYGIGPVISAGLLAHIDIEKAPTAGHIWSFAGLNPSQRWEKGQKRPWNAALKTLCWKIGESFVKFSGRAECFYGQLYLQRKAYENAKNEAGDYAGQAVQKLKDHKIGKSTEAYGWYSGKTGGHPMLPPAHIHARAKRWTVKVFLSHWHFVAWDTTHDTAPPVPYILTQPGHVHEIPVPGYTPRNPRLLKAE